MKTETEILEYLKKRSENLSEDYEDYENVRALQELGLETYVTLIEENFICDNLTLSHKSRPFFSNDMIYIIKVMLEVREEYNGELTLENIYEPVQDFSDLDFGLGVYQVLNNKLK